MDTVFAKELSPADREAYDAFVATARGGAWAQARAWAPVAVAGRRFTTRWFLARRAGRVVGAALILRPRAFGPVSLPVAIVERGPVVDDVAELPDVLAALRRAGLVHGVARLQVMPYFADAEADAAEAILAKAGFRVVQDLDGAHARTLRVDLTGKELFAGKQGESLRRKIRQAEKAGATAKRTNDPRALEALYGELMDGQGRGKKPRVYFDALAAIAEKRKNGAIFVCEHEEIPVSALYASKNGTLATFIVGASSRAEKSFSKMVPAMVAAIRWAKDEGCEAFDMGGIPMDGDTDEKRKSIAQFKLDFAKPPVRLVREHARLF